MWQVEVLPILANRGMRIKAYNDSVAFFASSWSMPSLTQISMQLSHQHLSVYLSLTVCFLFFEHHMNMILSAYQLDTLHCGFDDTVSTCNKK